MTREASRPAHATVKISRERACIEILQAFSGLRVIDLSKGAWYDRTTADQLDAVTIVFCRRCLRYLTYCRINATVQTKHALLRSYHCWIRLPKVLLSEAANIRNDWYMNGRPIFFLVLDLERALLRVILRAVMILEVYYLPRWSLHDDVKLVLEPLHGLRCLLMILLSYSF